MSGQSNEAAERSAHVERAVGVKASRIPVVEVSPGVWQLRAVVDLEKETARLRRVLRAAIVWHDTNEPHAEPEWYIEAREALKDHP